EAVIGPHVTVGDFCMIEADTVIGAHCRLEPYVYIKRWTTLGGNNEIGAGTVLGTEPLDRNFSGARSYLRIGSGNKIREHFTISRGTPPESATEIGDGNFIMTSGHIAHNCRIGNRAVIASCVLLGGYVEIGDGAFLSGGVLVHQFSKVGRLAMVSGNTRVNLDAPPFFTFAGFEIAPKGLNLVGLRRAGFVPDQIAALKRAYRLLYRSNLHRDEALAAIERDLGTVETRELVAFVRGSKRGICRP
ncbi:MAG: acyl-ACP--UDP-N-acetylglucosamine O-acyltransferase, partial [Acidobacteriota bacterium]|nr:acyl-ACP--UDP-N-acetylglucosamine O-acyltransferase [Acidobacteriota bacterium]